MGKEVSFVECKHVYKIIKPKYDVAVEPELDKKGSLSAIAIDKKCIKCGKLLTEFNP